MNTNSTSFLNEAELSSVRGGKHENLIQDIKAVIKKILKMID